MEKIGTLFMMAFLLIGTFGIVVAEEDEGELDLPEAKKVGFFGSSFDKVRLAFTFNKEKKIERTLAMAEKRLAEAEAVSEEDPERLERAQAKYDELVTRAEEILADMESRADDEKESVKDMERLTRIQNKFEKHREHAGEIYARALGKFEANNASDEKIERFEMFYERALNRSDQMETKLLEQKRNNFRQHKALSEMSDGELSELLVEIEENEGLKAAREKRVERSEVRVEKLESIQERKVEQVRARLNNSDLSDEEKSRVQEQMKKAEQKMEKFRKSVSDKAEVRLEVAGQKVEDRKGAVENELASRGAT